LETSRHRIQCSARIQYTYAGRVSGCRTRRSAGNCRGCAGGVAHTSGAISVEQTHRRQTDSKSIDDDGGRAGALDVCSWRLSAGWSCRGGTVRHTGPCHHGRVSRLGRTRHHTSSATHAGRTMMAAASRRRISVQT